MTLLMRIAMCTATAVFYAAVAAQWMGIGAMITLAAQGKHQAASDLWWVIAAAIGAAIVAYSLPQIGHRIADRFRRRQ